MLKNNKFCVLHNIDIVDIWSQTSANIVFIPSAAKSLHLGDNFFLKKIVDRLNSQLINHHKDFQEIKIYLTLRKHYKNSFDEHPNDLIMSLDWTSKIFLSVEEMIFLELQNFGFDVNIFNNENFRECNKVIFSPEIASSAIRIIGLRSKFDKVLRLFKAEGYEIIYLAKDIDFAKSRKIEHIDSYITGIDNGIDLLKSKSTYAFVGYDNFWMHVAMSFSKKTYINQRLKFTPQNYLNHITSLNNSSKETNLISYI